MKSSLISLFEVADIPGGAILGLFSLAMLGICVASFVMQREIPQGVLSVYQWVLGAFAASKTLKTIFGKPVTPTTPGE
jgi:uncharacterized membrane protein AbrB (regulator of aidB expression)